MVPTFETYEPGKKVGISNWPCQAAVRWNSYIVSETWFACWFSSTENFLVHIEYFKWFDVLTRHQSDHQCLVIYLWQVSEKMGKKNM
jgi:hypothetical protein